MNTIHGESFSSDVIKLLRRKEIQRRAFSGPANPYIVGNGSGQVLTTRCPTCGKDNRWVLDGICLTCATQG